LFSYGAESNSLATLPFPVHAREATLLSNKARVVLIEDEIDVRQRLARTIEAAERLELAGAAGTVSEGRRLLERTLPDVLLVDLGLPDGRGAELIRAALDLRPDMQVMVITVFGDEAHVVEAIEAGASAYLLKDASAAHVGRAIGEMLDGGSPLSTSVARYVLRRFRDTTPGFDPPQRKPATQNPESSGLSVRETEVLQLIAKGLAYSEIAATLDISVNTVGTHIKQIYRKLAVNSRGQAVFEAQSQGLLDGAHRRPH